MAVKPWIGAVKEPDNHPDQTLKHQTASTILSMLMDTDAKTQDKMFTTLVMMRSVI